MPVGYVSDARYVAIADCLPLFENDRGAVEAGSRAEGSVDSEGDLVIH